MGSAGSITTVARIAAIGVKVQSLALSGRSVLSVEGEDIDPKTVGTVRRILIGALVDFLVREVHGWYHSRSQQSARWDVDKLQAFPLRIYNQPGLGQSSG